MPKKSWELTLDDGLHVVEIEHGMILGRRTIRVDGDVVVDEKSLGKALFDAGSDHDFSIGEHRATLQIRVPLLRPSYVLLVDGVSVDGNAAAAAMEDMPGWGWLFVVGCGIIPFLTLGGAIPGAIGGGGAASCYALARNGSMSEGTRVAACAGVTLVTWGVFVGFAVLAGLIALGAR